MEKHVKGDGDTVSKITEIYTAGYDKEPPYVKLYFDDLIMLHDLPKSCGDVLLALIKCSMGYDNTMIINMYVKRKIKDELGYKSVQSISNAITKFVQADLIRRLGTGAYMLNPNIFGRGSWADVKKVRAEWLNINISYSSNRRVITCNTPEHQLPINFD